MSGPGFVRSLAAGALGFAVVYASSLPLGVLVHHLAPTPERALAALLAALLVLPFFLAFELLLRRGGGAAAALLGLLGRVLVLAGLVGAVLLEVLPGVVMLLLPAFAVVFLASELLALGLYASSRDPLAIATADALVLGWMLAISLPLA